MEMNQEQKNAICGMSPLQRKFYDASKPKPSGWVVIKKSILRWLKGLLIPRVIGFHQVYQVGTPLIDHLGRKRRKQIIGCTYTFTIGWLWFLAWKESRWIPAQDLGGLMQAIRALGPEGLKDSPLAWMEWDGRLFDLQVRDRKPFGDTAMLNDALARQGIKDRSGLVLQMEIRVRGRNARERR